jgi:hypothetical protein
VKILADQLLGSSYIEELASRLKNDAAEDFRVSTRARRAIEAFAVQLHEAVL